MGQFLPLLLFALACSAVLLFAGLGVAGNLRGALRYMLIWVKCVGALALVGVVLSLIVSLFTPSP